ncbi:TetR/AcrR family transcriptional regulator [Pectobacterium brasiliense]|uniref:TetR/AcrR family transcriptional regulator n=1 Tax=Pectobacterium brasiliense TaxID=180957 RepID=UPI0019693BF2|nr:TetR family transcriptional regulator [Pectobacterium brasiliense]MBN3262288.1 TetR family transcriptional regulator [Pectobacterium brasiliense]
MMSPSHDATHDGKDTQSRILEAALEVILDHGVRGATYRKIAQQAGLSPGTLTYRYSSIELLLSSAFIYMVDGISHAFRVRLKQAKDINSAREAVVDLICGDIWATPRHLTLSFELYALASRKEEYRLILQEWMTRSRRSLHLHFSIATACSLDAVIEGYTIHNYLNNEAVSREDILNTVIKLTS